MVAEAGRAKLGNRNYIGEDGFIHSIWVGDLNASVVERMGKELAGLVEEVRKKGKPVLILDDISKIGKVPLSARQAGFKVIKELDYDKCAIFGNYPLLAGLVKAVVLATGCSFKIKFVGNKQEAEAWLKNKHAGY